MKDGKAVQLFVSSERDCYYTMTENDMNVIQAIVFDDIANPENPWFMTYTDNHQVTPNESISEEEALSVIDSYSNNYKKIANFITNEVY